MTRETICSGGPEGEAYHAEVEADGSVCLMRTSDVDDGPTRSIRISKRALGPVSRWLTIEAIDWPERVA